MERGHGRVVWASEAEPVADEVTADTLAGASLLPVDDVAPFGEDDEDPESAGGWVLLVAEDGTETPLAYAGVVEDDPTAPVDEEDGAGSLALAAPLAADVDEFTTVILYNGDPDNGGSPAVTYTVQFVEDDQTGGDPEDATVPHEKADAPPEIGDSIEWKRDGPGDEIYVERVIGATLSRNSDHLSIPVMSRYVLVDRPRANGTWENVGGTTVVEEVGFVETTTGVYKVLAAGRYGFTGTVVFGAANTGTRRARFMFNHSGVTRTGTTIITSATASGSDAVQVVDEERMAAGDTFWFEAYQNSGGSLDIRGDSTGKFTGIKARRVSP